MKNCTKLHFVNPNDINDKIEEFFLGGYLSCVTQTINGQESISKVLYTPSESLISYELLPEDLELFIDPRYTVINSIKYAKILPVYDKYSLKQNLECRCSIIRGELPYNINLGIPLKALIHETQVAILNIINTTPGVTSCRVVSSKLIDKKFRLVVEIKSNFGDFTTVVG